MSHIQKSGVFDFKDIVCVAVGTWRSQVYYKKFNKTCIFFPDTWSQERVLEAIHESLHNITSLPTIQKNGNLLFEGTAIVKGESLSVNVVIDKFNNIVTAYPVIKK